MRKMREHIIEGKRIFVGLEDSKKTWRLCVRYEGMIVHETGMPAEYEVLRAYLLNRYPGCAIKVMYEAGFSGFWLHDLLEEDGIDCIVTPANKVTCAKDDRVKTDRRDARRLAKNLENGDYVSCHVPDRERLEDRQISRTLDQVQRDIKRVKNRMRRFLDFYGLNGDLKKGAWADKDYLRLADLELPEQLRKSLDVHLAMFRLLIDHQKELKATMKKLCKKPRYAAAVAAKSSMPGIGWLTAIRLTLEWGDMRRFPTGRHIASFTGLTPSEYSTGETVRRGSITSQSNREVRSWLIECAWRAIQRDPVLLDKYLKVWRNSGSRKKAVVAVARKLAVRMWAIERSGEPYGIGVIE